MSKVLVETSARHIHLSREAVEVLFGNGYQLTKKKDLSQPGQFACAEKLEVVGPKGKLKASILGPERGASQVELSLTDARTVGLVAPIRALDAAQSIEKSLPPTAQQPQTAAVQN